MENGKFDEGQALWDSAQPIRDFYTKLVIRSGGQARLKKAVMEAMNMPMGHMRPPSLPHSNEEINPTITSFIFNSLLLDWYIAC